MEKEEKNDLGIKEKKKLTASNELRNTIRYERCANCGKMKTRIRITCEHCGRRQKPGEMW